MSTVRNLRASDEGKTLHLIEAKTQIQFKAASLSGGDLASFEFVGYNGGALKLAGAYWPVVFDLNSTQQAASVPILYDHNTEIALGHVTKALIQSKSIKGRAVFSGTHEKVNEIVGNSKNGFPWQISVGMQSARMEFVESQASVKVNGQTFKGPLYVARDNTLREISVLPLGADSSTSLSLSASYKGGLSMFEEWVTKQGFDPATLSATQSATLRAAYDNEQKAKLKTGADSTVTNADESKRIQDEMMVNMRASAAIEHKRQDLIRSKSNEYGNPTIKNEKGETVSLCATALEQNWSVEKLELECIKAARPKEPTAGAGADMPDGMFILQAALAQACKMDDKDLATRFKPQMLDQAHRLYKSRIGLQELLIAAARLNGYNGGFSFKANTREILQHAFLKATGFTSIDIPNILATNFNFFLLAGYNSVDNSWRRISKIGRASDFKTMTSYRMNGGLNFKPLAPDGHIEQGTLSEQSYTNKANPYGIMASVTFVDLVNDNLGALNDVPRMIGRGGILGLVRAFWTEFLDNSAFFVAGNNNVSTGVLGVAGLNAALAVFRALTDPEGEFILGEPRYLVVPPALEGTAQQLYTSTNLVSGLTTAVGVPQDNPHARKYEPIIVPYLSDSTITGNSAVAYYLLGDANNAPVMETVFLDGQETPQVDTAEADFSQLGVQFRGQFHWGVAKQDPNGGVRSTGA